MNRKSAVLFVVFAFVGLVLAPARVMAHGGMIPSASSSAAVELRMDMRKLWEDHITYTRNYIISALASLDDTGTVAERLLRNQDDIGNSIVPI